MDDLVAPPDVEALAVAYLTPLLSAPVSTRYPAEGEGPVVRVQAGAGDVTGMVNAQQRLIVEAWALSGTDARRVAALAHAHLSAWPDVYRCLATTPVSYDDVNRPGLRRYQFVATVWSRMEAL